MHGNLGLALVYPIRIAWLLECQALEWRAFCLQVRFFVCNFQILPEHSCKVVRVYPCRLYNLSDHIVLYQAGQTLM